VDRMLRVRKRLMVLPPIRARSRRLGREAASSTFRTPLGPRGQCIFLSKAADLSQTADRESPAAERG
jgi:hypothetical protein